MTMTYPIKYTNSDGILRAIAVPFNIRENIQMLNATKVIIAKYSTIDTDMIRFKIIPMGAKINIGNIDHIETLYASNEEIFFFVTNEIIRRKRENIVITAKYNDEINKVLTSGYHAQRLNISFNSLEVIKRDR